MLSDLLVSEVRVKILKLFFDSGAPEFYHVREIARKVGTEINAVRRELSRLLGAGVLKKEPRGNRLYYRLREANPFFTDLYNWVNKETGLSQKILNNLDSLGNLKLALMMKPFLRGRHSDAHEVDLLLVGKVNLEKLSQLVKDEEQKLGREINYAVLTEEEFEFRKKRKDPFVINLLLSPPLLVYGDETKCFGFEA